MQFATVLLDLQTLILSHGAALPVTSGVLVGAAYAILRKPTHLFRNKEAASVMNFAPHGVLHCICGAKHGATPLADRRQICRDCGCEVTVQNVSMLDKPLSSNEIRNLTRALRLAAVRASSLELPPSIHSIEQLNQYLASGAEKRPSLPLEPPTPINKQLDQPTIH